MPIETQRFIHAANVRLDVPVSVQTAESLTDELREAFEDATIDSYAFVVDRCIALKVDYLLLSGNVFVESERSLRARLALLRGFERLRKAEIQVVVIPGISDPPEAWRAIPEMPPNVQVSYSSASEPVHVRRGDVSIATVSSTLWYGETDSFGIQVVSNSEEMTHPFRIGTVSESGFHEARRMAELTREQEADDLMFGGEDNPWRAALSDAAGSGDPQAPDADDSGDESLSLDVLASERGAAEQANRSGRKRGAEDSRIWDAGFISYVDEVFREGRLNYLTLTGEMQRITLNRGNKTVHAPGTTQPRHLRESDRGTCSLVEVSDDGSVTITDINTSSVDWKELDIQVDALVDLTTLLQQMKTLLTTLPSNESDCIWSVAWTLRGPLPVLQSLQEEDLDVAVAVELDVLEAGEADIELLHSIRIIPDEWSIEGSDGLGQQFAEHIQDIDATLSSQLRAMMKGSPQLTKGWRQRLSSLLPAMDPERIMAQLRADGADWFVEDASVLMPELLRELTEQPEDILGDCAEEQTAESEESEEIAVAVPADVAAEADSLSGDHAESEAVSESGEAVSAGDSDPQTRAVDLEDNSKSTENAD